MSGRPARFTQLDIERALKAAAAIGEDMAVEIKPDGTIRIARAPAGDAQAATRKPDSRPARPFVL